MHGYPELGENHWKHVNNDRLRFKPTPDCIIWMFFVFLVIAIQSKHHSCWCEFFEGFLQVEMDLTFFLCGGAGAGAFLP
jgi:hypothetical protein